MSEELRAWLFQKLKERHWSQKELSKQSGVSQPLISQTLAGDVPPSADFCIKIATALSEAPEKVLRLAEILPPASEDDTLQEIVGLARNLPPAERQQALDFLRFLSRKG